MNHIISIHKRHNNRWSTTLINPLIGTLSACIQLGYLEEIFYGRYNNYKSWTWIEPIAICSYSWGPILDRSLLHLAKYLQTLSYTTMTQLRQQRTHWHWSFCKMLWKELLSNQSSPAPLWLPNRLHSIDLNILSWLGSLGKKLQSLPSYGTPLWDCYPLETWVEK